MNNFYKFCPCCCQTLSSPSYITSCGHSLCGSCRELMLTRLYKCAFCLKVSFLTDPLQCIRNFEITVSRQEPENPVKMLSCNDCGVYALNSKIHLNSWPTHSMNFEQTVDMVDIENARMAEVNQEQNAKMTNFLNDYLSKSHNELIAYLNTNSAAKQKFLIDTIVGMDCSKFLDLTVTEETLLKDRVLLNDVVNFNSYMEKGRVNLKCIDKFAARIDTFKSKYTKSKYENRVDDLLMVGLEENVFCRDSKGNLVDQKGVELINAENWPIWATGYQICEFNVLLHNEDFSMVELSTYLKERKGSNYTYMQVNKYNLPEIGQIVCCSLLGFNLFYWTKSGNFIYNYNRQVISVITNGPQIKSGDKVLVGYVNKRSPFLIVNGFSNLYLLNKNAFTKLNDLYVNNGIEELDLSAAQVMCGTEVVKIITKNSGMNGEYYSVDFKFKRVMLSKCEKIGIEGVNVVFEDKTNFVVIGRVEDDIKLIVV